jgi:hypothetical protein
MKHVCTFVLAVITPVMCQVLPAFAQETEFRHITTFQTGSRGGPPVKNPIPGRSIPADDTVAVNLDVPFVNSGTKPPGSLATIPPTPCSITTGGYALDPADPGVKLNESVLLSAYLAGKKVQLQLDGCVFDKPRIISVGMSTSNN